MRTDRIRTICLVILACLAVSGCGSATAGNSGSTIADESNTEVGIETASEETTSQEVSSEEVVSEEITSQETTAQKTASEDAVPTPQSVPEVILGDEQFDKYLPLLEGKRVALFTNHTGIVGDENSGIGETEEEIKASWQEELSGFREQRKPYLLYEE